MNRIFGLSRYDFKKITNSNTKRTARHKALEKLEERYTYIFQRRHDCIHNCDRPKIAINERHLSNTYLPKVIYDLEFLVKRCHNTLEVEFSFYLKKHGFSSITRNQVGA